MKKSFIWRPICCFNTDYADPRDEIRSLQNQLEEMQRWNSALQARVQHQPTNQRGGGVGGAKDSPLRGVGGAKDSPLRGAETRAVTEQGTSANSSFMFDTFGKPNCDFLLIYLAMLENALATHHEHEGNSQNTPHGQSGKISPKTKGQGGYFSRLPKGDILTITRYASDVTSLSYSHPPFLNIWHKNLSYDHILI